MKISLSESLQLRGLAILMMVWLHCFNKDVTGLTYISLLPSVGGATIPFLLTRVAQICVSLYCFLSGYGLYCKYPYPNGYIKNKAFTLAKQYWFVLAVFAIVGLAMDYDRDYGLSSFLSNFLGYRTTWNSTLWFLLPYILLLLISRWIFVFVNRQKVYVSLPSIFLVWVLGMAALKFESAGTIEMNPVIKNCLQVCRLLLPFSFGAYVKKYEYLEEIIKTRKLLYVGMIILSSVIVSSRFVIWNHFTLPVCCLAFVFLFHSLNLNRWVRCVLEFFGKKSLYLWFCHAYFVYYFLRSLTFSFKYVLLIYLAVILYSLTSATILEFVYKKISLKLT